MDSAKAYTRLTQSPHVAELRQRHHDFYADLVRQAAAELTGPDQGKWLAVLETERDNVRLALEWGVADGTALEMSVALWPFWKVRGHRSEGAGWIDKSVTAQTAASLRVNALLARGALLADRT